MRFGLLVFAISIIIASVHGDGTVPSPDGTGSCNVVNVQCGGASTQSETPTAMAGRPGKAGPTGPEGMKGEKGGRGEKGDSADPSVSLTDVTTRALALMRVTKCSDLPEQFNIEENGFYLMQMKTSNTARHIYCDFTIYQGFTTCHQLRGKLKLMQSGFYRMQMTASSPVVEVYCNMVAPKAVTEIWNDMMLETFIDGSCEPENCHSTIPKYDLNLSEITRIVENSTECKQFIKISCDGVVLGKFASWISRSGEAMTYWGGAISMRDGYCACGETDSCLADNRGIKRKCNCDKNHSPLTSDEGYLTDISKLPVIEIKMGDLSDRSELASVTLGQLQCTGEA